MSCCGTAQPPSMPAGVIEQPVPLHVISHRSAAQQQQLNAHAVTPKSAQCMGFHSAVDASESCVCVCGGQLALLWNCLPLWMHLVTHQAMYGYDPVLNYSSTCQVHGIHATSKKHARYVASMPHRIHMASKPYGSTTNIDV